MLDYETVVEKCRKQRLNQLITNASMSHAGVLFRNLFEAALAIPSDEPKVVRIQCQEALSAFYELYANNALDLLNRGVEIRVLIADPEILVDSNPFLRTVAEHANGDVRLLDGSANQKINFVVVGRSAYRLEHNLETIEAVANFNDPVFSEILTNVFDKHWRKAVSLKVSTAPTPQRNVA